MSEKIIQHGAEANIILVEPKEKESFIIKDRIKKSYRLPEIDDKIRKLRTRSEGKLLEKAAKIIDIPPVIKVDEKSKEIVMEFVNGLKLSDNLDKLSLVRQKHVMRAVGVNIARLHDSDIVHGDLTTSNMILVEKNVKNKVNVKTNYIKNYGGGGRGSGGLKINENTNFKIFFIDFGLGFISHKIEDKAVDLHLLRQALEAKHFKHWTTLFDEVKRGYSASKETKKVLEQFKKVEARGRYKAQY